MNSVPDTGSVKCHCEAVTNPSISLRMRDSRSNLQLIRNYLLPVIFLFFLTIDSHALERKAIDFKLTNWDGRMVSMQDLRDKVIILTFAYAYCSAACPIITGRLSSLDEAMNSPRNVVYLHISVDPAMDTPERRKNYFNLYGIDPVKDGRWFFVGGESKELSRLWDFYDIEIKKIKEKRLPEGYYMQYTPKMVIIDREGHIRYEAGFDFSEDKIAGVIKGI